MLNDCLKNDTKEINRMIFPIYLSTVFLAFTSILLNKTLIDSKNIEENIFIDIMFFISNLLQIISIVSIFISFIVTAYIFAQSYFNSGLYSKNNDFVIDVKKEKTMQKNRLFLASLWIFTFLLSFIVLGIAFEIFGTTGTNTPINYKWLIFFTDTLFSLAEFIKINNILIIVETIFLLLIFSFFYSNLSFFSAALTYRLFYNPKKIHLFSLFLIINVIYIFLCYLYHCIYFEHIFAIHFSFNYHIYLFIFIKIFFYIILSLLLRYLTHKFETCKH